MLLTFTISGYEIAELIHESNNTIVYRAKSQKTEESVVLKVLKAEYPTLEQINRLKHEYRITANLDLKGIVKVFSLETHQNRLILVAEDFGGISLKQLITTNVRYSLADFLSIAVQVTEALVSMHAHKIIHKDIKLSNIIINPQTQQVKITDFSIASRLSQQKQLSNSNQLEGTLAYMSPEQTGRINRNLDYRSDFYSLGVSFYELLTGRLPFVSHDPLEVVYGHIAKMPQPIRELNPDVPKVIERIVNRLMAKSVEDRYQTAMGLLADLQCCSDEFNYTSNVSEFTVGKQDNIAQLLIPQKLYGREKQVKQLLAAWKRVCKGSCESIVIAGGSGVGKSALINEFMGYAEGVKLNQHKAYFVSGKFDQFQSNIPYAAIAQAWQSLIQKILTESQERITKWQKGILAAVGANAQVIIDLIPEVELIIGKQPPVASLGAVEAGNRIIQTFLCFIKVFARLEHPLVVFMDDMQWADAATLALWQSIVTDVEMQHLLFVAAHQDNQVNSDHPLIQTIENILSENLTKITLKPLSVENTIDFLADTLNILPKTVEPLAQLLHKKTQGNPFFLTQLLKSLYSNGLLRFDYPTEIWQWNVQQIQDQNISDNVIELMVGKLQNLPKSTQQILQLAACISKQFDLQTLSIISAKTPQEVLQDLSDALQEDLIVPLSPKQKSLTDQQLEEDALKRNYEQLHPKQEIFKFLHDRIQEAAYSLIPETQKQQTHLKIGQLKRQNICNDELENRIFEVVNHLNAGLEMISDATEKIELVKLNLSAGKKAKAVAAYDTALKYFNIGISLLNSQSWHNVSKKTATGESDLVLSLYESAAEAACLCGEFERMEELAQEVLANANNLLDCVKVYEIIIQARTVQNKPLDAVAIALVAVNKFGFIPTQPTQTDIATALESASTNLSNMAIKDLVNLPKMTNPQYLAIMRILSAVAPATQIANPELGCLFTLKQVELLLEFGNSPDAAFVYTRYGLFFYDSPQAIEIAKRFGQVGLSLASQSSSQSLKAMTRYIFAALIQHGTVHVRECLPVFKEVYQIALTVGNLEVVGYSLRELCHYSYLMGEELTTLLPKLGVCSQLLTSFNQMRSRSSCLTIWQSVLNWQGKSENPCMLVGEACDENQLLPILLAANEREGLFHFYLRRLILCYGFGDFYQAVEMATQARKYLVREISFFSLLEFYFYDSLTILASPTQSKNLLEQVAINQQSLRKWANSAPMNYQHKYDLVEAQRYKLLGQQYQAMEYYDRAISAAEKNGYIQDVALANECAAEFYLALGKIKIAQAYIGEAYHSYLRWGAGAKVKQLENKHLHLRGGQSKGEFQATTTNTTASTTTSKEVLDLATVIKASQAISSEIILDKLLFNLLHIILENSSAQLGCIILERNQQLFIEVADTNQEVSEVILQSIFVNESRNIPISIVDYVARTQKPLVLSNASKVGIFQADSYILCKQPKSVLCTPIFYQSKFIGLVYLENNLVADAFSQERLQIIQVLTSQAAIAIENARLFAQQEEKSQQLTASLAQIAQQEEQYRSIFENVVDGLLIRNLETGDVVAMNPAYANMIGHSCEELMTLHPTTYIHPDSRHLFKKCWEQVKAGNEFTCQAKRIHRNGNSFDIQVQAKSIIYNGKPHILSIVRDISEHKRAESQVQQNNQELEQAFTKLKQTQSQLVQTEKISQLGQLVAGVAHEVNNPVGFISGNLSHAEQYVEDLINLIKLYQVVFPDPGNAIASEIEAIDLPYLIEDLPKMISSMKLGTDRIRDIMQSLRNFSRTDTSEKREVDIHQSIDTTLIVLSHRLKAKPERPAIKIIKEYGNLPLVPCFSGQINQVLMNLLANAIDALDESNAGKSYFDVEKNPNIIRISTFVETNQVIIKVADNGLGMCEEVRQKLFDAFFTTKSEGRGTGLGLSISYQIITEAHNGTLECFSSPGAGAEFVIKLGSRELAVAN